MSTNEVVNETKEIRLTKKDLGLTDTLVTC